VTRAYWQIWLIRRVREIQLEQVEVLEGLSGATRVRVEVGGATLADLNQVDLARARLDDLIRGLDLSERSAEAAMWALIGAPAATPIPTSPVEVPAGGLPLEDEAALRDAALAHPAIEAMALMAESAEARARRARADRGPDFMIGLDWIETGEAMQQGVPGSGTDPVILMLGIRLPIWTYADRGAVEEARAEGRAQRAETLDASYRAEASVAEALATLRDADRRIDLYQHTLIPQAETTYASVVGAYQTGRTSVIATMIAQRELLDLSLSLARVRVEHAMARARLEQVVGRTVELGAAEREDR
jgi:outer membrane protein TolC